MDAFVKTRRYRKIVVTTREDQKQPFESSLEDQKQPFESSGIPLHSGDDSSSSYGRLDSDSLKRLGDESEISSCRSLCSSSEDRRSRCSSPISEFSYLGSSSDETANSSRWLQASNPPGRNSEVSPLFLLDTDVVANVLTFLDPSEIMGVLTMPLCKEWARCYGSQQDLWKTLCLLEPFKAKVGEETDDDSSSSSSFASLVEPAVKNIFGEYRLMFTSFVRCLRYLDRIQEDTQKGKAPSVIDYGKSGFPHFGMSRNLKKFLDKRRGAFGGTEEQVEASADDVNTNPVGVTDDGYRKVR
jgi:hypothetical protein